MHPKNLHKTIAMVMLLAAFSRTCFAQGEDSSTADRDLMVIEAMLPGIYANASQNYFDRRGDRDEKHGALFVDVRSAGDNSFVVTGYVDNDVENTIPTEHWSLDVDETSNTVRMRSLRISDDEVANPGAIDAADGRPFCDVYWRREAGQFRAEANDSCGELASAYQLSETQLWIDFQDVEAGDYALHRARPFQCYADIPGVGGGVDIPYKRYDGFNIHDQGGRFRFTSDEGQDLMIMLWTVDWPINNQAGIFTRDSLVLYVNELIDGEMKQHAYAFTPPASDRVGINLKWMLVNCFMESNRDVTPSM